MSRPAALRPVTLAEIPEPWRATLVECAAVHTRGNADVGKALQLILRNPSAETAILAAFRAAQVRDQVPALVESLRQGHPVSFRTACRVVGLFTGYHEVYVQWLVYRHKRSA